MTIALKVVIGLGALAIGGTGTYLTYDYLNKPQKNNVEENTGNNEDQNGQSVQIPESKTVDGAPTCNTQDAENSCTEQEL